MVPLIAETTTATGLLPGGLGGDAGGADELRAAPHRGAPELYDEGSLQRAHAPFSAVSRS